ncbi:MAG TPA: ROK family protein [Chthoniobacterales bacterium]|nr:ROK family protein [Chthoniobacterales bacterium]
MKKRKSKKPTILVVDIGGTHVKLMISSRERRKFDSGARMTPAQFMKKLKQNVREWKFDAVSIGFPAPVRNGRITRDPKHLGTGWPRFNFRKALKKPTAIINDAAMQALGSYRGGRMLFLGLGTGLGSAMVWPKTLLPLELGDLPYRDGKIIEQFLGKPGVARMGERAWKSEVRHAVHQLKKSFVADYVVLGGGNSKRFKTLPEGIEAGHNRNAYLGGVRLWETEPRTGKKKWAIVD